MMENKSFKIWILSIIAMCIIGLSSILLLVFIVFENENGAKFDLGVLCNPPCQNGGQCVKTVCNCTLLFTGDRCQDVVCSPPCENGGQCKKNNVCECTPSFIGDRCNHAVCSPLCKNGGQCMKNNVCKCTSLFYGDRCQAACIPPCENEGQCMKNNECKCPSLFNGDRCQDRPQCGVVIDNGGKNIGENNNNTLTWPWLAAVYLKNTNNHVCDGSVIHRHFVLTSAWCATEYGKIATVKLGLSDLKKGNHIQEYGIRLVHIHPEYNRSETYHREKYNLNYAIGLMQLEEPMTYNAFVRPVCLPQRVVSQDGQFYRSQSTAKAVDLRAYTQAISSSQNISPDIFMETIIRPSDVCRSELAKAVLQNLFPSPDLMFCTEGSSSSICNLVYGSPVIQSHQARDDTRIRTQVGIGIGCVADRYLYSLHLDKLIPWVYTTTRAALKQ